MPASPLRRSVCSPSADPSRPSAPAIPPRLVSPGTLYRNVDSLEALFLEVRETVAAEIHELLAQGLDANDMYDEAVRLATGIRMLVRLAHDRPVAGRFIVRFGLSDDSLRELLGGLPMENLGAAMGRFDVDPAGEVGVI